MGPDRSSRISVVFFRRWNWEHDLGEGELASEPKCHESHAAVYLDDRGFPYRVIAVNPDGITPVDRRAPETYVYDYVYDDEGNLIEKRSLDENGNVFLIVRGPDVSKQHAWYPGGEDAR